MRLKPRSLFSLLFFLCLVLANGPSAGQSEADEGELESIQRIAQGIAEDLPALKQANAQARAALRHAEQNLQADRINPSLLEQARLDLAAARAQVDSLQGRARARADDLQALEAEIAAARDGAGLPVGEPETAAASRTAAQQRLRDELRALIEGLDALLAPGEQRADLARRYLQLLQQRFDLDAALQNTGTDPRRLVLRQQIDSQIARSADLRTQLRSLRGNSAATLARKRLLEIRALDASERAELKGGELALLQQGRLVTQLATLSENRAMPEKALSQAQARLDEVRQTLAQERAALERKQEVIAEQEEIVRQRGAVAAGEGSTLPAQMDILKALVADIAQQSGRVNNLVETARRADERFNVVIGQVSRRELLERRQLPDDVQAWQETAADLSSLPLRVLANLSSAVRAVQQRIVDAGVLQWLLLLAVEAVFLCCVFWLRRFLDRSLIQKDLDRGATLPMCALYWTLPYCIPAGVLIILGLVMEVSNTNLVLLLTLFLVLPAVFFLLKMSFYLLVDEAPESLLPLRMRLYRELQWVLTLVGVIITMIVIGRVVALSPGVIDLIDRFAMVCLLLIAVPALHVRQVILARSDQNVSDLGFWVRFGATLALLAPLVLIASAIIGIVGYVPLAWSITAHLGWLAAVVAGWLLAEALLRDGAQWLSGRISAKSESADFWNQNIIGPVYRLLALGLLVLAALLLFRIFGWSTDTPVIRWLPQLLNARLFSLGNATIHVRELVITALVVFLVFWAGSWSKQVSYKFAYVKISDHGIRQSLSTFTQYIVVVVGLYIALKTIGLDLTALTVFAGALGVGIGFGLQNITSNFISGILLLIERPLRVSDIVTIEGVEGTVTHIGIRALKVRTFEQQEVVVPNSSVITKPFTNRTGGDDIFRTMFMIRAAYDSDPHQAIDLITGIVKAHPGVIQAPGPKVVLNDFTESCMLIRVHYFTHVLGSYGMLDVRSEILFGIWDAFREAGIRIPFPQQDMHVRALPDSGASATGTLADS